MKKFIIIVLICIGSSPLAISGAFFKSTAVSSENVFTALITDSPIVPSATVTLTPSISTAITPSVNPTLPYVVAGHIVISEVQIGTNTSINNDFIELYNPTSIPYDLDGHRLVKRGATSSTDTTIKAWNTQTIIQPHGFYLWASSDNSYHLTVGADTATSENIALNNSIGLRQGAENTGTLIDSLSWSAGANSLKETQEFSPQPGNDHSIERKAQNSSSPASMSEGGADEDKGNGFDTDHNATDFILRSAAYPQNIQSPAEHL